MTGARGTCPCGHPLILRPGRRLPDGSPVYACVDGHGLPGAPVRAGGTVPLPPPKAVRMETRRDVRRRKEAAREMERVAREAARARAAWERRTAAIQ